ncbi:hypothetical protein E2C01_001725 [Portunus trituberculatus]|uniref:Uncharacterized protein n=1 Tax=Portunus trituberculatus TaxID=210409 RepID=A0A5B7CJZ9_PORTR|nr:hypothetical protein [Portunus trituberculatus]
MRCQDVVYVDNSGNCQFRKYVDMTSKNYHITSAQKHHKVMPGKVKNNHLLAFLVNIKDGVEFLEISIGEIELLIGDAVTASFRDNDHSALEGADGRIARLVTAKPQNDDNDDSVMDGNFSLMM